MLLKYKLIFLVLISLIATSTFADEVVWRSGKNLHVTITGQNKFSNGKTPLNEHPVSLVAADLSNALSALEVWDKKYFKEDEVSGVFTISQQRLLGVQLANALKLAKPDEDVIFAVAGTRNADGFFSFSGASFTAGRAFYHDGKLNIILGDYMRPRNKGDEAMAGQFGEYEIAYHFSYGSRSGSKVLSGFNFKEHIIKNPGVDYYVQDNKDRRDWIVIDVKKASDFVIAKRERKNKSNGGVNEELLKEQAAIISKERREMRAEMARMRKEMKELNQNSDSETTQSIEQRLATLDELLKKKLITQDEYDEKKKDILNDI